MFDKFISIIIVIFFIVILKTSVISFFIVSSSSMENTLLKGDNIIINKMAYEIFGFDHSEPEVGEIIVFYLDGHEVIKRVAAVNGDLVLYNEENVFVNNSALKGNYYNSIDSIKIGELRSMKLKDDELFVVGDNKFNSQDSRDIGPIRKEQIEGKAFMILFSENKGEIRYQRIGKLIK